MNRRIARSLVRLHNQPLEDPGRLKVVDTNVTSRSMSGLYKSLDPESVVDLDIDIIWERFIKANPRFKKEFDDPMFDIVNDVAREGVYSTTVFKRTKTITQDEISYTTKNRYTALLITVECCGSEGRIELRYSLNGVTYYRMTVSDKIVIIPPEIEMVWSMIPVKGVIVTM